MNISIEDKTLILDVLRRDFTATREAAMDNELRGFHPAADKLRRIADRVENLFARLSEELLA